MVTSHTNKSERTTTSSRSSSGSRWMICSVYTHMSPLMITSTKHQHNYQLNISQIFPRKSSQLCWNCWTSFASFPPVLRPVCPSIKLSRNEDIELELVARCAKSGRNALVNLFCPGADSGVVLTACTSWGSLMIEL